MRAAVPSPLRARVAAARPFANPDAILTAAEAADAVVTRDGWLEAFRHHPRIGERVAERRQSDFAQRASSREQARVAEASPEEAAALAEANRAYEARFGHVFIVWGDALGIACDAVGISIIWWLRGKTVFFINSRTLN